MLECRCSVAGLLPPFAATAWESRRSVARSADAGIRLVCPGRSCLLAHGADALGLAERPPHPGLAGSRGVALPRDPRPLSKPAPRAPRPQAIWALPSSRPVTIRDPSWPHPTNGLASSATRQHCQILNITGVNI